MAFTWVRPADPSLLAGRPLLDLGAGDGQTLASLVEERDLVVATDHRPEILPLARSATGSHVVAAAAAQIPFADDSFACVLAADLFHHLPDEVLGRVLREAHRVLRPGGSLVAWWYERPGRPAPDAPRFPRPYEDVAMAAGDAGVGTVEPLELVRELEAGPPTVGMNASWTEHKEER